MIMNQQHYRSVLKATFQPLLVMPSLNKKELEKRTTADEIIFFKRIIDSSQSQFGVYQSTLAPGLPVELESPCGESGLPRVHNPMFRGGNIALNLLW